MDWQSGVLYSILSSNYAVVPMKSSFLPHRIRKLSTEQFTSQYIIVGNRLTGLWSRRNSLNNSWCPLSPLISCLRPFGSAWTPACWSGCPFETISHFFLQAPNPIRRINYLYAWEEWCSRCHSLGRTYRIAWCPSIRSSLQYSKHFLGCCIHLQQ